MALTPHDPNCVFCKIIDGEIPSARVLETDLAVAFLDINPVNPGHTLIVPRAHHVQLSDLPDNLAAYVGSLLPRLCRAIREATAAEGLNVIVNNGSVAGQRVDHCHWHIIPRFAGDPFRLPWRQGKYSGDELNEMRSRLERAVQDETGVK